MQRQVMLETPADQEVAMALESVVNATALEEALALARQQPVTTATRESAIEDELKTLRAQRSELEKGIELIRQFQTTLSSMEADAKNVAEERIRGIRHQVADIGWLHEEWEHYVHKLYYCSNDGGKMGRLDKELRELRWSARLDESYPRLSIEPLRWRNKEGLPKLLPFRFGEPNVRFSAKSGFRPTIDPSFNSGTRDLLENCYNDVFELLKGKVADQSQRNWWRSLSVRTRVSYEATLTARFTGVIPSAVKEKIAEHRKRFDDLRWYGSELLLIAEPQELTLEEVMKETPRVFFKPDPLIVAYYPKLDPKSFWLVADFDTTPAEEAMATYFSERQ